MSIVFNFILSFVCAALSALGMGGGGILLIYLTAYLGTDQKTAQGMNLVFFIPLAVIAIIMHAKKKYIKWKISVFFIIFGIAGVYLGFKVATLISSEILSKLFGGFLLIIGIKQLFSKL